MSFKFPFTNYHELNLTWVLDKLKELFEESAENVSVIQNYDGRLTAVETELPTVSETASEASRAAAAAGTLAQTAKATADTAQENAIQAQNLAGTARREAQAAQTAANEATQAAQQAQTTAQNFDGRITEAQNNASRALEASRSFENRVQSAITTANNASQTATNAQGIAMRANQNAALALDTLNAQRSELERIGAEQAALITEETESGKTEIEDLAQSVLESIPADYTALSALVDKKSPVIINSASGSIASFDDGAENMKIQKLVVNIEPVQAGSGDPSPTNIRPISGHTGAEIEQTGKNLLAKPFTFRTAPSVFADCFFIKAGTYTFSFDSIGTATSWRFGVSLFDVNGVVLSDGQYKPNPDCYFLSSINMFYWQVDVTVKTFTLTVVEDCFIRIWFGSGNTDSSMVATGARLELGSTATSYEPYTGNTVSVNWETEAGTVYGGTLTLNPDRTGTLVVTHAKVDITSLNWSYVSNSIFNLRCVPPIAAMQPEGASFAANAVCSALKVLSYSAASVEDNAVSIIQKDSSAAGRVWAHASKYSSVSEFLADMVGQQMAYEMAEYQTVTLTAAEVSGILTTLYGTNNIWADTGDITKCYYPADTKLYIDNKIAELQALVLEQ